MGETGTFSGGFSGGVPNGEEGKKDVYARKLRELTNSILRDYECGRDIDKMDVFAQPDQDVVLDIVDKMLNICFPGYYRDRNYRSFSYEARIAVIIEDVCYNLQKQIAIVLPYNPDYAGCTDEEVRSAAEQIALSFLEQVPKVRALIDTDLEATLMGDPAAYSKEEIVLCYPGLLASSIARIAHELFVLGVPIIPRMMTEYAHSKTGIDIHPGATIGKYFFIDHGTGVVIGETSEIGDNVKIYQGVTIGALSTKGGRELNGSKRHPTIEDDVTIYAGATILGGRTVIGRGSTVGGSVFITESLEADTLVSNKAPDLAFHKRLPTGVVRESDENLDKT